VKTLVASLQHFTTVISFQRKNKRTVKTLVANLQHFTQFIARFIPLLRSYTVLRWCVDCKQSAAQERKKREKPLPRSYTVLCRFIYPNLSVRLKKVHGFYKGFLHFPSIFLDFSTKSAVFSRFISVSGNRGIYVF
jgi:hypothetical protein